MVRLKYRLLLAAVSIVVLQPTFVSAQTLTPQQKEEERKKEEQKHHADEQKRQEAEKQKHAQEQQHQAQEQQRKAEEQKHHADEQKHQEAEKLKQAEEQKHHAEEQKHQEAEKLKQAEEQKRHAEEQKHHADEQKHQEADKLKHADEQKHQEAEKLKQAEEQKHKLEEQKHNNQGHTGTATGGHDDKTHVGTSNGTGGNQNAVTGSQHASPSFQQGRAQREEHHQEVKKLVEQRKQQAATEKRPEAVQERIKIQNQKFAAIHSERKTITDAGGHQLIQEPGGRTIVRVNNQVIIQHNDFVRIQSNTTVNLNFNVRATAGGGSFATYSHADGTRIEVEVDSFGRPLRRVRILPDGRRFVLFESRPFAIGVGFGIADFILDLPRPHYRIPEREYIVDIDDANEDDIYNALYSEPLEPLERIYSLDEVRYNVALREHMRSVNINSINFGFGSWDIGPDQGASLEEVAAIMKDIIDRNPGEVFLIEGHTDAVGSDEDNLSLSDRRADAVAQFLSSQFGVPGENLVTQGYGKQFLLVPTDAPEWRNRRVVIRRITPLISSGRG